MPNIGIHSIDDLKGPQAEQLGRMGKFFAHADNLREMLAIIFHGRKVSALAGKLPTLQKLDAGSSPA